MGDAWSRQVHPDMEIERRQQPFNVERLTNFLDGGAQSTALRRKVGKRRWGRSLWFMFKRCSWKKSPPRAVPPSNSKVCSPGAAVTDSSLGL